MAKKQLLTLIAEESEFLAENCTKVGTNLSYIFKLIIFRMDMVEKLPVGGFALSNLAKDRQKDRDTIGQLDH
jgi:hypothetical protein